MTLGSLFDGSGTCPLAAALCGITPVWASEIEAYPIHVTEKNFPEMRHLGDITAINGAEIEPVDIVTFGSPCQGLSAAGAQKGIFDDDRSNLFFEAIRVIKEMRESTHGKYPRYVVWENVPGAFSSRSGRDFLEVLRAFVEAAGGKRADVPEPARRGKTDKLVWRNAGCILEDGYSIGLGACWTPNTGACPKDAVESSLSVILQADAPEKYSLSARACLGILKRAEKRGKKIPALLWEALVETVRAFHLQQDPISGRVSPCIGAQRQATVGVVYDITGATSNSMKSPTEDSCFRERDVTRTLDTWVNTPECNQGGNVEVYAADCRNLRLNEEVSGTLQAKENGGYSLNYQNPVVYQNGEYVESEIGSTLLAHLAVEPRDIVAYDARGNGDGEIVPTLTGNHESRVTDYTALVVGNGQLNQMSMSDKAGALNCMHDQQAVLLKKLRHYIVRRLTPLECCRLQGFPDWWEEGAGGSDSARYKMWGNGMALPCVLYVMEGIADGMQVVRGA